MSRRRPLLPILEWGRAYTRATLSSDLLAALIVTVMLIPQSLAYAMLAGLPAQLGLYASVAPLLAYTVFGSSRTLAVGPVAILSLMTAAAASRMGPAGSPAYIEAAVVLALLSGVMLAVMGFLRLGILANFLSHPVVSAFISASGILIATAQLGPLLGISASGHTLPAILASLLGGLPPSGWPTPVIGLSALLLLFWWRQQGARRLRALGLGEALASRLARLGPMLIVILSILIVSAFHLDAHGVRVVGAIPVGLPPLTVPSFAPELWRQLALPAFFMSLIGFVESVSVARTLGARRRQRVDADQELLGLGTANLAAGLVGGFPVTGGFARSVVNFEAGAETPAAGAFTAIGILLVALFATPLLHDLPVATLAATIILAVISLVDLPAFRRTLHYSPRDFFAMAITFVLTLLAGVEIGVMAGVLLSILLLLARIARPHVAEVGCVPGTEHFRNIERHKVVTSPHLLSLRIDESLNFANAGWLEGFLLDRIAERPEVRHVVLMCSAVNAIDSSALEALEAVNRDLRAAGVSLHLSEVKGPVMDRLQRSELLRHLSGQVFLSQHAAFAALAPAECSMAQAGLAPGAQVV